jgi:hypothetical protein
MNLALIPLVVGFAGLFLILYLFWTIKKESAGTPHMKEIAGYIQKGLRV